MQASRVEALLRRGRTPLGGIAPRYRDLGLPNAMASALAAVGAVPGSPPVPDRFLDPDLFERQVVVLAVDGLGYLPLLAARRRLRDLALLTAAKEDGALLPITAALPSTTVSGLGSLCTGRSPQEHGLIGYRMFLREFGTVFNMLRFAPADGSGPPADPTGFLQVPTAFEDASDAGVPAHVLTRGWFVGSALSRILYRGAKVQGFVTSSDLVVHLRRLLRDRRRKLVFAYWDMVDSLFHVYGTEHDSFLAELAALDRLLEREVLRHVRDATILITADHGHINTSARTRRHFRDYPRLLEQLACTPSGEPRLTYLHARDGDADALLAATRDAFGDWARACTADEAFAAGLFGDGTPTEDARGRVGDVVVAPKRNGTVYYGYPREHVEFVGRHGGLSPEEMLVPLLVVRR